MSADPGSRNVLNPRGKVLFPDETLEHRIARALCDAGSLPRKEFHEAWQVARRVRRRMRGGRVFDLAAGHGVLGMIMLLLDDSSPDVVCVDRRRPRSFARARDALAARWPRIAGRVRYVEDDIEAVGGITSDDIVVSAHACGALTDRVLDRALAARCRVAVLPCCHDKRACAVPSYAPWMEVGLAIDTARVVRLEGAGYAAWVQRIPAAITPKNRLIVAGPG